MAVDHCAVKRSATADDHTIFGRLDICAHLLQILYHHINPVGFFYLQFCRIFDDCLTICKAGKNRNRRDLINQSWNHFSANNTTFQIRGADCHISRRLSDISRCLLDGHIGAHIRKHTQDTISCRIDAYIFHRYTAVRCNRSCYQKICCRRNVTRHNYFLCIQLVCWFYIHALSFCTDIHAEFFKHQLRMVSTYFWFCHRCLAIRIKSCKQNR